MGASGCTLFDGATQKNQGISDATNQSRVHNGAPSSQAASKASASSLVQPSQVSETVEAGMSTVPVNGSVSSGISQVQVGS